jgi:hypothetical protein
MKKDNNNEGHPVLVLLFLYLLMMGLLLICSLSDL